MVPPLKAPPMAKTSILIIEDDPDIVELLQYNLEKNGYPVRTASDGEAGLQAARRFKPGMILLDLMMPGMDGLEVCRHLKRDPNTASIPLMMITAKSEESDVVTGLELGADDYLAKPFSPREVLARVRAVLRRGQESSKHVPERLELGFEKFGDRVPVREHEWDNHHCWRVSNAEHLEMSENAGMERHDL